ncbi:MAG: PKD domain-containing protein [Bacteroidia bacterium]|nr:PKD domain-containing protein [Bacteroidia bacterium]
MLTNDQNAPNRFRYLGNDVIWYDSDFYPPSSFNLSWTGSCYGTGCTTPVASFNNSANNLAYTFTAGTLGGATSWAWDFGDGGTSTQQNPSHTYASAGTYTVCLVVSNACGADTICNSITTGCNSPVAAYSYNFNGFTVTFTDQSSDNPTSWDWDFGDGTTSTQQNPVHTYTQGGIFNVCLTSTNSCGAGTDCQSVKILLLSDPKPFQGRPEISLYPNPTNSLLNLKVSNWQYEGPVQILVLNALGQTIRKENFSFNSLNWTTQLDLSNETKGVYFLQIKSNQNSVTRKFILN